jgi:uncharacterized protein YjbI with pentapeptide repeats
MPARCLTVARRILQVERLPDYAVRSHALDEPRIGPFSARVGKTRPARPRLEIERDLTGARFEAPADATVFFRRVAMEGVDFSGTRLSHFVTAGSRFIDCDFSRVRFQPYRTSSDIDEPTLYVRCNFDRADMRKTFTLTGSRFEECTFRGTKIKGWEGWCAEFVDCVFACRIEESIFSGRPVHCYESLDQARTSAETYGVMADRSHDAPRRTINEFRGNDFSKAELRDVSFRYGIDIGAQLWPEGVGYRRYDRWPERIARVIAEVRTWPPSADRDRALELLDIYFSAGNEEQSEVFLSSEAFQGWLGRNGLGDRLLALVDQA